MLTSFKVLTAVEWHWNMQFGSLDLDTRFNAFMCMCKILYQDSCLTSFTPVTATLHKLYDREKNDTMFLILPLYKYIEAFSRVLGKGREHFPRSRRCLNDEVRCRLTIVSLCLGPITLLETRTFRLLLGPRSHRYGEDRNYYPSAGSQI